jgi:hypothetical protein
LERRHCSGIIVLLATVLNIFILKIVNMDIFAGFFYIITDGIMSTNVGLIIPNNTVVTWMRKCVFVTFKIIYLIVISV